MLLRMYTRWAERQGYKVELMEIQDGEEAASNPLRFSSRGTMPMAG